MFLSVLRWLGLLVANFFVLIVAYIIAPFLPMFAYKSRWAKFWSVYCLLLVYAGIVCLVYQFFTGSLAFHPWMWGMPLNLLFTLVLAPNDKDGMNPHLPTWLSWFDQPDDDLDGDHGWLTEHRWFRNSPKVNQGWRRYINRVFWLWRNPSYGFDIDVLGFKVTGGNRSERGNVLVSDRPLNQGWLLRQICLDNGKVYWFFYAVYKWSGKYCISIKLGWKIWENWQPGDTFQFVCSLNPFASFAEGSTDDL